MKFLLVNLPLDIYPANNRIEIYNTMPPYGLGYIASVSEVFLGKENVKLIDAEYRGLSLENINKEIVDYNPDIIGINVSSANFFVFESLLNNISQKYLGKIIVGGPHAIICPNDFFKIDKQGFINFICLGEGEFVFKQFFEGYEKRNIENICYKDVDGTIVSNPKKTIVDFNNIYIDRSVFQNDLIFKDGYKKSYMVTSRGCPNYCSFCAAPYIYGHNFFLRSKESLLKELVHLKSLGVNHIRFIDDLFLCSNKRIQDFISILSELNLSKSNFSFEATGRVDILSQLDDNIWKLLSGYGLDELEIGIESGSQRILNLMNKHISINNIFTVIEKCLKYHVKIKCFIICGYYTETVYDLEKTIALCKSLKHFCKNLIRFSATPAKAYPGTLLFDQITSCGYIPSQEYMYIDLSQYSCEEKEKLDLLKARTRYNAVHKNSQLPLLLSEISGGADSLSVIQALIEIALIS